MARHGANTMSGMHPRLWQHAGFTQMAKQFATEKININLFFKPYTKGDLFGSEGVVNQILVLFDNGKFELLPQGIVGRHADEYLGYKLKRVTHWSPMPSKYSVDNPNNSARIPIDSIRTVDLHERSKDELRRQTLA